MDDQLTCMRVDHDNKPIVGICTAKECTSNERIFCITCLSAFHSDCKNQYYEKEDFIKSLKELKLKTQQEKESQLMTLMREVTQQVLQLQKQLELYIENILSEYNRINPIILIDQILDHEKILSAENWKEGYKLLNEKPAIVPQSTDGLLEQLNIIKKSINQINNIQTLKQQESNSKSKWNNITEKNPLVFETPNRISTLAVSPNSEYIASASDRTYVISIWDPETGNLIGYLKGHSNTIYQINFSKCGQYIVSCSEDTTIIQWDLANRFKQIGEDIRGHKHSVMGVEYSPDQRYIVSCSWDKTLRFWDSKSGEEQVEKQIQSEVSITRLSLSPIQNEVVFGDVEGTITIWDYEQRQMSRQSPKVNGCILSIKYSPDGKQIISSCMKNRLILWDAQTISQIRQFSGHTDFVRSAGFSPDQNYIISGGNDKTVMLWDTKTGKQIGNSLTHHQDQVRSTQFSFCGKYIITGGWDKQIRVMIAPIDVKN